MLLPLLLLASSGAIFAAGLSGTAVVAPAAVDLSASGASDWAHWGLGGNNGIDRKLGGNSRIGDYTSVGGAVATSINAMYTNYSWSDGAPSVAATTRTGLRVFNEGRGFEFSLPADSSPRSVTFYFGTKNATGTVTATLDDASAPAFTTQISQLSGRRTHQVTLDYSAASANETLTVSYTLLSRTNSGWISLEAVSLLEDLPNQPPVINPIPDQVVVEGDSLSFPVTAFDADGPAALQLNQSNSLPLGPEILTDLGGGNGLIDYTPNTGETGSYTVTVTATDGEGAMADENFAVSVLPPGSLSQLTATITEAASIVDLSLAGELDWVNWGLGGASAVNRKDGVTPQIGDYSPTDGGPEWVNFVGARSRYIWSDGAPRGSANTRAGIRTFVDNRGVELSVPAALMMRTLKMYVGGKNGSARFTASLAGAADVVIPLTFAADTKSTREITLDFAAAAAGQELTLRYELLDSPGVGWASLEAVALAGPPINQAPQLSDLTGQTVIEGELLSFDVLATDPDGPAPLDLSSTNTLPGNPDVFVLTGTGSGEVNWTPALGDSVDGPYSITVTAVDGGGRTTSKTMAVDVVDDSPPDNMPPVFDALSAQTLAEGAILDLLVRATDSDGPDPLVLSQANTLPGTDSAQFTDNGDGTGRLLWTAGSGSMGTYSIDFRAFDGTDLVPLSVAVTVTAPGSTATLAGSFELASATVDLTAVGVADWAHWGLGGNQGFDRKAGVSERISDFTPLGGGVPTATEFMQARYNWTDGAPSGTGSTRSGLRTFNPGKGFEFSVEASQQPRTLVVYVGARFATGAFTATLSDNSVPAYSTTITRNGAQQSYAITINYAAAAPDQTLTLNYVVQSRSGNGWISLESAALQVGAENLPPTIATTGPQTITEGDTLAFAVVATDLDGPAPLTLAATTTLPGDPAVLIDNGNGNGSVSWVSSVGDAGGSPYEITLVAADSTGSESTRVVPVVVEEFVVVPNKAPLFLPVPVQSALEGMPLQFTVNAYDNDGPQDLLLSQIGTLPGATADVLADLGNGLAEVQWTPPAGSAGTYQFDVVATDGEDSASETVTIVVQTTAQGVLQGSAEFAPSTVDLTTIGIADWAHWGLGGSTQVDRKSLVTTQISDFTELGGAAPSTSNGMAATYLWSDGVPTATASTRSGLRSFDPARGVAFSVPAAMESRRLQVYVGAFNARGRFTAALSDGSAEPFYFDVVQPTGKSSRQITLDFVAATPGATLDITYVVAERFGGWASLEAAALVAPNAPPVITPVADQVVLATQPVAVTFGVSDADGPAPLDVEVASETPAAGLLQDNGDGSWSWGWTPAASEAGSYEVTITAIDGLTSQATETFTAQVTNSAPPELAPIAAQNLLEGQSLSIALLATDTDSTPPLVFSQQSNLPGAAVTIQDGANNGEATLQWTSALGQGADQPYSVVVTVTDSDGDTAEQSFTVQITPNETPVIAQPGPFGVKPSELLQANLLISDSDGPLPLQVGLSTTLPGAAPTIDAAGLLVWQSGADDESNSPYTLDVTVTDGLGAVAMRQFTIEVEQNQRPAVSVAGEQSLEEWQTLELLITATDPDGSVASVVAGTELPGDAPTVFDNGDGTWLLVWSADTGAASAQPYNLSITAIDDLGGERELLVPIAVVPRTLPNIVLILTDDQGVGDVSYAGFAPDLQTPAIDALAAEGMQFRNFYANSTVCSPTRASLLTGRYPSLVGVPGTVARDAETNMGQFTPNGPTLPELLKSAGYTTALIGKWHLGDKVVDTSNLPTNRGFDLFRGFLGSAMDYYTHDGSRFAWPGDDLIMFNETVIPPAEHVGIHTTDLFTPWALEFIEEQTTNQTQPFFMEMAYTSPHDPVQPPPDVLAAVQAREPGISLDRANMVALMEHTDQSVAAIVQKLKDQGVYENTLIIYTSDNGGFERFSPNNGPYRGGKLDMYEGGIRVPGVVSWPNRIAEGTTTDEVAVTMDLYPTIAEIVGTEITHPIDGRSVLATLREQNPVYPARDLIFENRSTLRDSRWKMIYAVRSGNWKLVQDEPGGSYELYDLTVDPLETNNLASTEPVRFAELQAVLAAHRAQSDLIPWQRELVFEQGILANVTDQWQTIALSQPYREPMVIATPVSPAGSPPMVTRIRGLNEVGEEKVSFDIRVQRADNLMAPLADTEVRYVVFEAGVYNELHHGIKLEALPYETGGRTNSSGRWSLQDWPYANTYSTPVVVGQVYTNFDDDFSVFWDRAQSRSAKPKATSMRLGKHVGNDPDITRGPEKLAYVVAESGASLLGDMTLYSKVGATSVVGVDDAAPSIYTIEDVIVPDNVVLSGAGMKDVDGGWPVLFGPTPLSADSIHLTYQEDQIGDSERSHLPEQVAYMLLGNSLPTFVSPVDPVTIAAGDTLLLPVDVTDLDNQADLVLSLSSDTPVENPAMLIEAAPGIGELQWNSRAEDVGSFTLTITADDGQGGVRVVAVTLTVDPV